MITQWFRTQTAQDEKLAAQLMLWVSWAKFMNMFWFPHL